MAKRKLDKNDFTLPKEAFGEYSWGIDLKKRMWRWNSLLQEIRHNIGPFPSWEKANYETGRRVVALAKCPMSYAVRMGKPPPFRSAGNGKEFVDVARALPSPLYALSRAKASLDEKANHFADTDRSACHIVLGHRELRAVEDTSVVWEELERLHARLDPWRKLLREYATGGLIVPEIDRCRIGGSRGVRIHVHVLAEPRPFLRGRVGNPHLNRLREAWEHSARKDEEAHFHKMRLTTGEALRRQMFYLYGLEWRGRGYRPKILDGMYLPSPRTNRSARGTKRKNAWLAKGRMRADQLFMIIAFYTSSKKPIRWWGDWHAQAKHYYDK